MSIWREALDHAQILGDYVNIIAENCMMEEMMGSSYDKPEKWVMYLIQWLDYRDHEDWTENQFEHMTTAQKILYEFHKSKWDTPRNPGVRDWHRIFLCPRYVNP
jgi:hypothetical protein